MDLGMTLLIINIYGPYLDRARFLEMILRKSFMNSEALILGGDLHFSLGAAKVWGSKARPNSLTYFFLHSLEEKRLVDLVPENLRHT
jgi:hypothetical protein